LLNIIYILLVFFSFTSCNQKEKTQDEIKSSPTILMFGLKSYTSIDKIHKKINQKNGTWTIIENNKLAKNDKRPRYEIFTVSTNAFKDNKIAGITVLEFFNNRLMSVTFYPNNWTKYKKYLEKKNINILNNQWKDTKNGVTIRINEDNQKKHYFETEDTTLIKEYNDWIAKYS